MYGKQEKEKSRWETEVSEQQKQARNSRVTRAQRDRKLPPSFESRWPGGVTPGSPGTLSVLLLTPLLTQHKKDFFNSDLKQRLKNEQFMHLVVPEKADGLYDFHTAQQVAPGLPLCDEDHEHSFSFPYLPNPSVPFSPSGRMFPC